MNEERTLSRRTVLGTVATGAAVALAGCAGNESQEDGDDPEAQATPTQDGGQSTESEVGTNSSGEVPHAEGEGNATERDLDDKNESGGGAGGNSTNGTNGTTETDGGGY